jgi:GAF domain-containing protein
VRLIEAQLDGGHCTVMLLNPDGVTVHSAAGPSMPPDYMNALNGLPIGPAAGSCGTAMYRKETVIVSDILNDPLWAPYRNAAAHYGLRACWSMPILLDQDTVLGSFAMYYREARADRGRPPPDPDRQPPGRHRHRPHAARGRAAAPPRASGRTGGGPHRRAAAGQEKPNTSTKN